LFSRGRAWFISSGSFWLWREKKSPWEFDFILLSQGQQQQMSLSKNMIQVIAESMGLPDLDDHLADALAQDVEFRLRDVIQEATKFMSHGRRSKLMARDINTALSAINVDPCYGHSTGLPATFRAVAPGSAPASSFSGASSGSQPAGVPGSGESGEQVFYIDDEVLTFETIATTKLPPCPNDIQLTCHWLAIDGVQPAIRQNPSAEEAAVTLGLTSAKRKRSSQAVQANTSAIAMSGGGSQRMGCSTIDPQQGTMIVEHKPLVKHVLSKELQSYYDTVTEAIKSDDARFQEIAIESIRNDCGLQQLTPYFAQFILDEVSRNLTNLTRLNSLMRMTRALLDSTEMYIEPYLHQLMPAILTCVVGRRLCSEAYEDHWSLREYSAESVELICKRYMSSYSIMQPRITQTFLDAILDPSRPLPAHYGAIVGFAALGHRVVELLLIPNVAFYYREVLQPLLEAQNANTRNVEAIRVRQALLDAVGKYLHWTIKEHAAALAQLTRSETRPQHQIERLARLLPTSSEHLLQLLRIFGPQLDPFLTVAPTES
jgi:transcription initiation factor TFIID subunit 6